jgi:iron complex outermembrane recepter protein
VKRQPLFTAILGFLAALSALAQAGQSISGHVKDPSGLPIPAARVLIQSATSGSVVRLDSDRAGAFAAGTLGPGEYRVVVSSPGFATESRTVTLAPGQTIGVDFTLTPDMLRQSINVTDSRVRYQIPTATTATRTDTPLMDIPQSIQVVPHAVLEDQQVVLIGEAARNVSSVTRAIGFTERGDKFLVRGLLIDYSLKNGFKNNSVQSIVDVANVDRVEVVKGPSSVLYGRIEPGGVVNVLTKHPLSEPHYSGQLLLGKYGLYRPTVDLSGPLNRKRTLLYRFNGAYEHSESYVDFVHSESIFLAPVLTFRIGGNTTLTMEAEHLNFHGRPNGGLPASSASFDVPTRLNIGESTDRVQNRSERASYYLTHVFNERWWLTNGFSGLLIDSARFHVYGPESTFAADRHTINRQIIDLPENSQSYFERVDAVGKFSTGAAVQHTFLGGIEVSRERFERGVSLYPAGHLDTLHPVYGLTSPGKPRVPQIRRQGADTGGVYIQDQISIFTRLKLLLGLRLDISKTLYRDYSPGNVNDQQPTGPPMTVGGGQGGPGGTGAPGAGVGGPMSSWNPGAACGALPPDPVTGAYTQCSFEHPHAFSPRAGLLYQPASTVSLYASYSKSFNPLQLIQYLNFQNLKPFIGRQFEFGAKFDLWNKRIQATTAVYRIVHEGFPLINPANPFTPAYSGFRRSKGAEIDITAQVIPGLNVTTSYGHNEGFLRIGFPSGQLLGAPRHEGSIWSVYLVRRRKFQGVSAGGGLFYVGERNGSLFATFKLPAYTRTDAMIAYSRARWRLQANFKNLANVKYYDTDAVQGLVFPGSPFTIEGGVSFRF